MILAHLRLVFIDFSSAFNCIQHHILAERLNRVDNLDSWLICWLMGFLTEVSTCEFESNRVLSGSPQGCSFTSFICAYTNECKSQLERCHIIKFADDSVIDSLLNSEDIDHGPVLIGVSVPFGH